jgi:hypothetical protein
MILDALTSLAAAGLEVPPRMQGLDRGRSGPGPRRSFVIMLWWSTGTQPIRVHLRTYVEGRYKITTCRDQPYGGSTRASTETASTIPPVRASTPN